VIGARFVRRLRALGRGATKTGVDPLPSEEELVALAKVVGDDWAYGPYYDEAEPAMDAQWRDTIWPFIEGSDFSSVVELAAGHGRNSAKLLELARRLYLVDINSVNIEFLRARFGDDERVVYIHNNGVDLAEIEDEAATFVYSFDAMVHFDSDVVRAYLREFNRVLAPEGRGFCHYSNYTGNPTGSYREHPGWRNFMSRELFEHYLAKEGLTPLRSFVINETLDRTSSDAITLFEKCAARARGD